MLMKIKAMLSERKIKMGIDKGDRFKLYSLLGNSYK